MLPTRENVMLNPRSQKYAYATRLDGYKLHIRNQLIFTHVFVHVNLRDHNAYIFACLQCFLLVPLLRAKLSGVLHAI